MVDGGVTIGLAPGYALGQGSGRGSPLADAVLKMELPRSEAAYLIASQGAGVTVAIVCHPAKMIDSMGKFHSSEQRSRFSCVAVFCLGHVPPLRPPHSEDGVFQSKSRWWRCQGCAWHFQPCIEAGCFRMGTVPRSALPAAVNAKACAVARDPPHGNSLCVFPACLLLAPLPLPASHRSQGASSRHVTVLLGLS